MKKQMTIAEAKAVIERNSKNAPLSKDAAYFQNESHINARADRLENLFVQGYITEDQLKKMQSGYIGGLRNKYL